MGELNDDNFPWSGSMIIMDPTEPTRVWLGGYKTQKDGVRPLDVQSGSKPIRTHDLATKGSTLWPKSDQMDENSFPGTCCQRDNTYLHIYLCLICINAGKDEYKFKRVRGWPVNLLAWLKMQYRNKMLDFFASAKYLSLKCGQVGSLKITFPNSSKTKYCN